MLDDDRIRVFDSQGEDYKKAFQVFLDHTIRSEMPCAGSNWWWSSYRHDGSS